MRYEYCLLNPGSALMSSCRVHAGRTPTRRIRRAHQMMDVCVRACEQVCWGGGRGWDPHRPHLTTTWTWSRAGPWVPRRRNRMRYSGAAMVGPPPAHLRSPGSGSLLEFGQLLAL